MIKLATLTCMVLCSIISVAQAQNNFYEAGYVIQNGDTIQGYILRSDEGTLNHNILFKKELSSASNTKYAPADIDGFGFLSDKLFFSPVEVELRKKSAVSTELRFAKNLLRGEISLYKIQVGKDEQSSILSKNSKYYYVIEKEGQFHTLRRYKYKVGNQTGTDRKYIGILKAVTWDCLDKVDDIPEKLKFDDKSIINIVSKYNTCKNPEAETITYTYKVSPIVKHGIEASYNKRWTVAAADLSKGNGYSIGYFWDITMPDLSRKFSDRLGIYYNYLQYNNWDYYWERYVPETVHMLSVPLQFQYNFTNNSAAKLSPFIYGGLTAQVSTDSQINYVDIIPLLSVGGGFYYKRIKAGVTVNNPSFYLNSAKLVNIGLGYRLDKN